MSAFIVSNKTLKRVASVIANICNDNEPYVVGDTTNIKKCFSSCKGDALAIAKKLYKVNVESVNHRYHENTSTKLDVEDFGAINAEDYHFASASGMEIYQAIKSARCWRYQSCEKDSCVKNKTYIGVGYFIETLENLLGLTEESICNSHMYGQCAWDEY